jgi:hypothetical protein
VVDKVIADRFENVLRKADTLLDNLDSYGNASSVTQSRAEWEAQCLALLASIFPDTHPYIRQFQSGVKRIASPEIEIKQGKGVLLAVYEDFKNGYTWTLRERVHAEVFDEYLDMASQLVSDGYATAGAVIAGSTLEEHLRKLCQKNNIATHDQGKAKKVASLNDELLKQSIHLQGEWRSVQSWFDIRNDAAHNTQTKYTKQEIEQMIDGIRGYMARHPA